MTITEPLGGVLVAAALIWLAYSALQVRDDLESVRADAMR